MSFRGNLLRAGIDSDGKVVTIFRNDGRLDIATASTKTTGTIRSANFAHTESANSMSKITEVLRVSLDSEYYTGDWVNAIVGRIDFGTAGDARGGMAAAICAEMNMPAKSYASIGGPCYSLDCEFNCPTGFVAGDRVTYPIAFLKFGAWGGAVAQFDDEGYIFHTDGLTAGAGNILSANSRTLRVNIEGADKYIYLSDTEDDLGSMVVDSVTISPTTGVVGITIDSTIAAGSFEGISIAPTLSGQQTKATGMTIDYNYSGGDINAYGIDVDIQQTGETSGAPAIGSRGNIQGIRSDARVAYTIDDAYALRGSCYVLMTAAEEANDCVGVFATLQHTGTITRGATTSAFCAMKADVSNGCTGSWNGQCFNLFMGYGSSVNCGDTTAIIYGYTHADARADYGIIINNYSPYMLAGIRLSETAGASPAMESCLWIDALWGGGYSTGAILIADDQAGTALAYGSTTDGICIERINVSGAATSGSYLFGKYVTLAQSATMVDGFIMGEYVKVSLAYVAYENYAIRGRMCVDVAQTGNTGNQYLGVFGAVELASGAHALAATGGAYGVLGTASLAGGSLDQPLIAGYFDCDPTVAVAGVASAVKARMQNYCNYGVNVLCQTSEGDAAVYINTTVSAKLHYGIAFEAEAGSRINHAFRFASASNLDGSFVGTITFDATADGMIKIDVAGTDYYIPFWNAASVDNEWADVDA